MGKLNLREEIYIWHVKVKTNCELGIKGFDLLSHAISLDRNKSKVEI